MVSPEFVAKRYNCAPGSVQKETASLRKRDCRARATHLGAVNYMITKERREMAKKLLRQGEGLVNQGEVL
jgi:hypothetical protein